MRHGQLGGTSGTNATDKAVGSTRPLRLPWRVCMLVCFRERVLSFSLVFQKLQKDVATALTLAVGPQDSDLREAASVSCSLQGTRSLCCWPYRGQADPEVLCPLHIPGLALYQASCPHTLDREPHKGPGQPITQHFLGGPTQLAWRVAGAPWVRRLSAGRSLVAVGTLGTVP